MAARWLSRFFVILVLVSLGSGRAEAARYASIVIEAESGAVIEEVNADTPSYPASLTKMMTLYLVFEALEQNRIRLDTQWPVSAHAATRAPSRLGLEVGQRIAVRDAILALVTKSANDAAAVAAEGLAGSEPAFAERMTAKARRLGMASTTFRNASGLPDPAQRTTARDLARLSLALWRDFPQYWGYFSTTQFAYGGSVYANHNHLMKRFEGMDGIKTGFINASGFNLAASAVRGQRRLIAVVMGGPSARARDDHMAQLLDAAFRARVPRALPDTLFAAADEPEENGIAKRAARAASAFSPVRSAEAATPAAAGSVRKASAATALAPTAWRVRLGSYGRAEAAEKAAAEARGKIAAAKGKATVQIEAPSRGAKRKLWTPYLAGLSKAEATKACRILHRERGTCVAVPPAGRTLKS